MPAAIHGSTPTLTALDARGRRVREVNYHRCAPATAAQRRVEQNRFDAIGQCVVQRDPRLWALFEATPNTPANLSLVYSLSGRELSRDSVDAGFSCTLFGEAGQPVFARDGKDHQRELEYDELLRPLALFEQGPEQPRAASERYVHADADPVHTPSNACGRLLRHDDPAGSTWLSGYSLTGDLSVETRRFLPTPEWPDWPLSLDERDGLLEPGQSVTRWRYGPIGQLLEQTDASANRRFIRETVAGQVHGICLQLAEGPMQSVLEGARYDALGQIEEECLGNGVAIQREYGKEDSRLTRLIARRTSGEALQDLHYCYDPVGNVLSIEDKARPLVHFANQRVDPLCKYAYDSLYQLIESRGWEAGASNRGPGQRFDPGAVSNYRQTYRYDAAGNLLELAHHGAQSHGRVLHAEKHSNRCLPAGADFTEGFDANGNLLHLLPGQALHWGLRNQLREVVPVTRPGGTDDRERYVYDGAGQRVRKLGSRGVASRTHTREVRYLPGLERHDDSGSRERFEVITLQAGTCSLRVLRWQKGKPADLPQGQLRYGLGDHLGSVSLELDADAGLISHEVFHPFGTTAWWAGRHEIEAGYKTVRYSGKERDATGLYYYGARYYAPWLQRWLNADPAGEVDGLNLYLMVRNNPLTHIDPDGHSAERARARWKTAFDFHRRPIASVAPGIVRVHLDGDRSLFEAAGFTVDENFPARRQLTWLSIDSNYQGKIAGVERALVSIQSITGQQLNTVAKTRDADHMAFINGGFFNMSRVASSRLPQSTPIGGASIDGRTFRSVPIPEGYEGDYTMLRMPDFSHIHSGPVLARGGMAVFNPDHLGQTRFQFDQNFNTPGRLVHANQRNTRSAISQPASSTDLQGRTRLVVGVGEGRGPGSSGYAMDEWADTMARIDRLNTRPGRSVNLDGGASSVLGVVNRAGDLLVRFGHYEDSRQVGNFIAYARRR